MKAYKVLGFSADICECDVCGKTELRGTYGLEEIETGLIIRAGSSCGSKMTGWTSKVFASKVKEDEKAKKEAKELALRNSVEYIAYWNAIDFLDKENIELHKKYEKEAHMITSLERTYESRMEFLAPFKIALRLYEMALK